MVDIMTYQYSIVNYRGKEVRNIHVISTNKKRADEKLLFLSTNVVSRLITPKCVRFIGVDFLLPFFRVVGELS